MAAISPLPDFAAMGFTVGPPPGPVEVSEEAITREPRSERGHRDDLAGFFEKMNASIMAEYSVEVRHEHPPVQGHVRSSYVPKVLVQASVAKSIDEIKAALDALIFTIRAQPAEVKAQMSWRASTKPKPEAKPRPASFTVSVLGMDITIHDRKEPTPPEVKTVTLEPSQYLPKGVIDSIHPIQMIVSEMGSGKTVAIKDYILPIYSLGYRVVVTSNRVSYTYAMAAAYGFENYLDGNYRAMGLVIQIESFHKLQGKAIDCLVIDEHLAICKQWASDLHHGHLSLSQQKFKKACQEAKKIILCDASNSTRMLQLIAQWRSEVPLVTINPYRAPGMTCWIVPSLYWLERLQIEATNRSKIIIACTIRRFARESVIPRLEAAGLTAGGPNVPIGPKQYRFYDCFDTPTKDELADINDEKKGWSRYQVVLYTPVVQQGIDFNCPHFDVRFGMGSCQSVTAETLGQMLARGRYVARKEEYICIEECKGQRPTTYEDNRELYIVSARMWAEAAKGEVAPKKALPVCMSNKVTVGPPGSSYDDVVDEDEWTDDYILDQIADAKSYNDFRGEYIKYMRMRGWTVNDCTGAPSLDSNGVLIDGAKAKAETKKVREALAVAHMEVIAKVAQKPMVNISRTREIEAIPAMDRSKEQVDYYQRGSIQHRETKALETKLRQRQLSVEDWELLHLHKMWERLRPDSEGYTMEEQCWLLEKHDRLYRLMRTANIYSAEDKELEQFDLESGVEGSRRGGIPYSVSRKILDMFDELTGNPARPFIIDAAAFAEPSAHCSKSKLLQFWEISRAISMAKGTKPVQVNPKSVIIVIRSFLESSLGWTLERVTGGKNITIGYKVGEIPMVLGIVDKLKYLGADQSKVPRVVVE